VGPNPPGMNGKGQFYRKVKTLIKKVGICLGKEEGIKFRTPYLALNAKRGKEFKHPY